MTAVALPTGPGDPPESPKPYEQVSLIQRSAHSSRWNIIELRPMAGLWSIKSKTALR